MSIIQGFLPHRQAPIFMTEISDFEDTIDDTSDYIVDATASHLASIVIAERMVSAFECICPDVPEEVPNPKAKLRCPPVKKGRFARVKLESPVNVG